MPTEAQSKGHRAEVGRWPEGGAIGGRGQVTTYTTLKSNGRDPHKDGVAPTHQQDGIVEDFLAR